MANPTGEIVQGKPVWEGSGVLLLARVLGWAVGATPVTQSTFSGGSIYQYVSTSTDGGTTWTSDGTGVQLTVADVISDDDPLPGTSGNADARWDVDSSGYNFYATVAASLLTGLGSKGFARVEYVFTPGSGNGEPFVVGWEFKVRNRISND